MDELAIAQQQIQVKRVHGLKALLPSAPPGWPLSVNTNMNAGIALAGGGVGVEGDYEGGNQSFKITVMANNAMVASMAPMLGNAMLVAQMGKITGVGKEKFVDQDGQLTGLSASR